MTADVYVDVHVIELCDDDWTLLHSRECRPSSDCPVSRAAEQVGSMWLRYLRPGRYVCGVTGGVLVLSREATDREES